MGVTASRPSIFSPIGFHLPVGRLLRASRPVNQGHRAPPRPPRGFITGIPMAQALATNLLPPGPAQPSDSRAQSTRSPPAPSFAVHDRALCPQPPPVRAAPPLPAPSATARAPEGRQAARQARQCARRSPRPRPAARSPQPAGTMLPARCARLLTPHLLLVLVQLSPARGHRTTGPRVSAPPVARLPADGDEGRSLSSSGGGGGGGGKRKGGVKPCLPPPPPPSLPRASWRSC